MYGFLKNVPLFRGMEDNDLIELCTRIQEVRAPAGTELFAEGDRGDRMYIITEGELEIIKQSGGREVLINVCRSGEVVGEIALLEEVPRTATVRSRTDVVLAALTKEQFDRVVDSSPTAARALFYNAMQRLRSQEAKLRQSERMAQLGTLTAGVAHELNNPAAAARRGAEQLQAALPPFLEKQVELLQQGLTPAQEKALSDLGTRVRELAAKPVQLDSLQRSDREYELETWLDDHGVADAWEVAPALVSLGFTTDDLEEMEKQFGEGLLTPLARWLQAGHSVYSLLYEIGQGVGRISEIVKALKQYSYLDQAPVQMVDVHEGLENTLVILRHKLKTGIDVRREYSQDLPRIEAYGSELNQVWTNLIDNAADAMDGKGTLSLRTRREGDFVVVEVEDSGHGIPPDIQHRIFDPFFTTKPLGKGTGLGLDITYNTVVNKHRGDIKVRSRPGQTVFEVRLPLQQAGKK